MITTLVAKIASEQHLTLFEVGHLVAFFDSKEAQDTDLYESHGGRIAEDFARQTWREHGRSMNMDRAKAVMNCGSVKRAAAKVERQPDESLGDCVSRAIPVLLEDGTAETQDQAVAIAVEMCGKCNPGSSLKGPEEFAQWVADQGDKVEAAWMRGTQVFVSMPASEGREDFEDVIHELQELLGDDYMVDVQTEAEPQDIDQWERVKGIYDDDEEKSLTPYQKWLDAVGIIGHDSPFAKKHFNDLGGNIQGWPNYEFKVDADEDIRDEEPDAPILRLARGLADIFARQEAEVLAAVVESNKGKKSARFKINQDDIDRILRIIRSFDDEITQLMEPFAEGMVGEGGAAGIVRLNDQVGAGDPDAPIIGAFDVTNPEVQKFLETYAIQLADQVQQQSADAINRVLQQSLDEGATTATMAKRIQDTGRFSIAQAERIARTESARAYVTGQDESWKQSGVVVGARWLLAPGACPICQAAAAVFNSTANGVPVGEAALKKGQTLSLPGGGTFTIGFVDLTGPPIHPHDRCDKVPVLTTDAETAKAIKGWFDEYADTGKYPAPIKVKLYRFAA